MVSAWIHRLTKNSTSDIMANGSDTYKTLELSRLPKYTITNGVVGKFVPIIPKNTQTRSFQTTSNSIMKKPFCKFCYNRRRPSIEFKSHFTKTGPEFGAKIVCPLLLAQQCAKCGEIGHTPKMCTSKVWLCCDQNLPEEQHDFCVSHLENPDRWQHPIPPALQTIHNEWVEKKVKTSRLWIIMDGDHTEFNYNFALCQGGKYWVPFEEKMHTEYELMVLSQYRWMRRNIKKCD